MCLTRAAPFPWLAVGITLNTLRPLGRSIAALRKGEISIDLLDVAATFAALATGRPITAAFVIWMVGVGDLLLDISANNARSALSMLMRRREQEALRVLPDGGIETVPVSDLQVGDHFMVHTGHGIVADGKVVSGLAEVDEKALTGESRLLSKKEGDPVFASTVVVEGQLVVEVERSGKNTEAAKIERILNTVGSKPLTLQRDALDVREQARSSDVRGRLARRRSVFRRDPRGVRAHHRLRNRHSHRGTDERADRHDARGARRECSSKALSTSSDSRRPTSSSSTRPVRSRAACRKWSRWSPPEA